jgi:hypothetical protein
MDTFGDPRIGESESEIASAMKRARRKGDSACKVIFLIGAGCSITAGIPGAMDVAREMVKEVARDLFDTVHDDPVAAYRDLVGSRELDNCATGDLEAAPTDGTIDWYRVYDDMFRHHFTAPDDVRDLFERQVSGARGTINWAHLCLGELVARGYISTVITTNFDQLVLAGMVSAGVMPVVCDGIGSLDRITGAPRHPQLLELHGSRHTYLLRNATQDVTAIRDNAAASAAINKLFQYATVFVAAGYGGRETGVMDLLIREARTFHDKNLFWISHSPDPNTLSPKVREFLATSRNSRLLVGRDADSFFLSLCQAIGIGAPGVIADPLASVERVINQVAASTMTDPTIRAQVEMARERLARLRPLDARTPPGDRVAAAIAAIQEARLAGRHAEAYRLAAQALDQ